MSNLNKVLLMGRLTRDPELRYTPQGTPVSEIGLAINREYTAGNERGGERRKETTFVDVTLWGRQAEVVCQYLKKGEPIFIEGRLSLDTWEQDGQKRSKMRVVAVSFQFIGSPSGARQGGEASAAFAEEDAGGAPAGRPSYGNRSAAGPPRSSPARSSPVGAEAASGDEAPSRFGQGQSFPQEPSRYPTAPTEESSEAPVDGPLRLGDSEIPF